VAQCCRLPAFQESSIILILAGKTAISRKIIAHAAALLVYAGINKRPKTTSQTPLR